MKRRLLSGKFLKIGMICVLLCALGAGAHALEAHAAKVWLGQFASGIEPLVPLNDPLQTADPARAGEYLLEYDFGTVTAGAVSRPSAEQITAIDLRTDQVTDCRGMRVGMNLAGLLNGTNIIPGVTQLHVLSVREDGGGWSWAYLGEQGVYGVEFIAYDADGAQMTEYTLTYVIEGGVISAIRMRMAPATQAQANQGLETALEIASRQQGEILAAANAQSAFKREDAVLAGKAVLGIEVADFVLHVGEPQEVQTLPHGAGRILLYDGAAVTISLDEQTGREIVRSVSVSSAQYSGPRGLTVGLPVQEAAALFRCDQDVYSLGGALYVEGEALGEAPCGMLTRGEAGDLTLAYLCVMENGAQAVLEAGVADGALSYWRLLYRRDGESGV